VKVDNCDPGSNLTEAKGKQTSEILFVCLFIYLFVCLLVYLFVCLFVQMCKVAAAGTNRIATTN
jgi:cytochrome c oxidase assembly protein Cox11